MRFEALEHRLEAALAQLWLAMQSPPASVRSAYEALRELDLGAAKSRAAQLALQAHPAWSPDLEGPVKNLVMEVAVEIRAIDQALNECREWGRSGDPNQEYRAFGGHGVFIIPRAQGIRTMAKLGQNFDRRGLVHNRLLPDNINGLVVRLYDPALAGPGRDGSDADLISALFAKVQPEMPRRPSDETFRVTALTNEAELADTLRAQIAALDDAPGAMAVVWPELAISPTLKSIVIAGLESRALADETTPLGFVVAGSWHQTRGDGFVNLSPVMDEFGGPLLEVIKRERYQLKDCGRLEGLDPGEELPILVYGDVLIAFGICKDFCDKRAETPFMRLDVDLIVVPSLGDENTLQQHIIAADTLAVRYGTRALVVQQCLPNGKSDVWGSVLRPATVPRGQRPAAAAQQKFLDRTRISCTIP